MPKPATAPVYPQNADTDEAIKEFGTMNKIEKARVQMVLEQPFFASLSMRLKYLPDDTCKTAWTDGATIGYNPQYADGLTGAEVKCLIAHEVLHVALLHHLRRGGRDKHKWNTAADCAVNLLLTDCGFTLPDGALFDRGYRGMSAEEIFTRLPAAPPPPAPDGGEVRDAPENSPAGTAAAEADIKMAISQAIQAARMSGKIPAGMARDVRQQGKSSADWRSLLREFVDATAKNDFTWTRPNRRHVAAGLYLPSMVSQELQSLAVVIDTSASISLDVLSDFQAEIAAILSGYPSTCLHVIYCDARVNRTETIYGGGAIDLQPVGGGGTDFRPPFAWIAEQGLTPACLIYLTDLACWTYPPEPDYPVLWAATERGKPPFGTVVMLK